MASPYRPSRLLIIPGLNGSGADHWQTWLEAGVPGAVRPTGIDWQHADIEHWADRIDAALASDPEAAWVAVAHSFGCLALARQAARGGRRLQGALLVAPASPDRFKLDDRLVDTPLPYPATLVISDNDPWMPRADAHYFGQRWGCEIVEAGPVGHINPAAGYGPWPLGRQLALRHLQRAAATQRLDTTGQEPAALQTARHSSGHVRRHVAEAGAKVLPVSALQFAV